MFRFYCYRCGKRLSPSPGAVVKFYLAKLLSLYREQQWVCTDCYNQLVKWMEASENGDGT